MNKESQKRIIEINHAISGIYGQDVKATAIKINESRKQILKRLERKKKLAPIIHDQLYSYLEKFPEQKLGLNQQFVKKKKAKLYEFQERYIYKCPSIVHQQKSTLTVGAKESLQTVSHFFKYRVESVESDSDQFKS